MWQKKAWGGSHLQPSSPQLTLWAPFKQALFTGKLEMMDPIPGSQRLLADPCRWPQDSESAQGCGGGT